MTKRNALSFNEKVAIVEMVKMYSDSLENGTLSLEQMAQRASGELGRTVTVANIEFCVRQAGIKLLKRRKSKINRDELKKLKAYITTLALYIHEVIKINPKDVEIANQKYDSEIGTIVRDNDYMKEYREVFENFYGRS